MQEVKEVTKKSKRRGCFPIISSLYIAFDFFRLMSKYRDIISRVRKHIRDIGWKPSTTIQENPFTPNGDQIACSKPKWRSTGPYLGEDDFQYALLQRTGRTISSSTRQ